MTYRDYHCPVCGEAVNELVEGYCGECRDQRQRELDEFNWEYDRWNSMTEAERENEIRTAIRRE